MQPVNMPIVDVAKRISEEAPYTGGPLEVFEIVGRDTMITLLENGMLPYHRVLDVGCGALRNGYWLVRFLDAGCYCGIEPQEKMLNPGLRYSLGDDLVLAKSPRFSNNKKCDFKVFGNKFDLVFARSIITHGGPGMVCRLFEQFRDHTEDDAVMLLSYWPNTYLTKARRMFKDKMCMSGDELPFDDWRFVFVMTYSFQRLHSWADEYGLAAENWLERPLINEQMWLRVTKNNALPRPMRATERPKRRSNSGLHLWSKVIRHRLRPN